MTITEKSELDQFKTDMLRRFNNIEQHLVNLIVPIQGISETLQSPDLLRQAIKLFSQPIQIDDRSFRNYTQNFLDNVQKISKTIESVDLGQMAAEMKYIGNRLKGIEERLNQIEKNGIPKTVNVEVSVDGYKVPEKRFISRKANNEQIEVKNIDQLVLINELLSTFTPRERSILKHALGLLGEKKIKLKDIAKIHNVSAGYMSQLFSKTRRKLSHQSRRDIIKKINISELTELLI